MRIHFSILLLTFCYGCKESQINLNLPYQGDKLVVYSAVESNTKISIDVQKTYPATGNYKYISGINNAKVILKKDDELIEYLKHDSLGIYSSTSTIWKQGASYKLEINAPNFPKAVSNIEKMPDKPIVIFKELGEEIDSKQNPGVKAKKLVIKVKLNPNEPNYYHLEFKRKIRNEFYGVNSYDVNKAGPSESPCGFDYSSGFVFSDFCNTDSVIIITRGIELNVPYQTVINPLDTDEIIVTVKKINKSAYLYFKSYYEEEGIFVAFKPPFPRYSNIEGGYGIISLYNSVEYTFNLKKHS